MARRRRGVTRVQITTTARTPALKAQPWKIIRNSSHTLTYSQLYYQGYVSITHSDPLLSHSRAEQLLSKQLGKPSASQQIVGGEVESPRKCTLNTQLQIISQAVSQRATNIREHNHNAQTISANARSPLTSKIQLTTQTAPSARSHQWSEPSGRRKSPHSQRCTSRPTQARE